MAKGRSTIMKRSRAPGFWPIARKMFDFVPNVLPGPHNKTSSYPLLVLIREVLQLVKTAREAKVALRDGLVLVDGVVRTDERFPVGLMDVIEIPAVKKAYRLLPSNNSALSPVSVSEKEKTVKLCKVVSKTTIKGGKIQYGLHDGRSLIPEKDLQASSDDSLLIEIPSQKVLKVVKFAKDSLVLVIGGRKLGLVGSLKEIRSGTFVRSKSAVVTIDSTVVILPALLLIAIGEEKTPSIAIT